MKERWTTIAEDAQQKQEQQFDIWQSGENIPFETPEAKALYQERVGFMRDAIQMKIPKRISIAPSAGGFPIEYAGITWKEAMYDYDKLAGAWAKYHEDFDPDAYMAPRTIAPGKALETLGLGMYRWAGGGGLRDDQEYQFVEKEYMKDTEYYDLIDDPTGFFINTYWPRIFKGLEALQAWPVMPPIHELPMIPGGMIPFGSDELQSALNKMTEAGNETLKWLAAVNKVSVQCMSKGMPGFSAGFTKAPFDVIGDSLRGTRGVLMDMFRHPDELLEACERITPFMVKCGVKAAKSAGHIMPFIPLHKGADTFMSEDQFNTFYWPTLKKLIIGLANEGTVPQLFVEGAYNKRLELIDDLPKGTAVWWFDATDMKRAKETVGRTNCIAGNVPSDILCTGTPDDVKDYCKELIDVAGKDGGFILMSGAGIQGAKPENVKTMIDFSKEYGVYR